MEKTYYESNVARLAGPEDEPLIFLGTKKRVYRETIEQALQEKFERSDQPQEKKIKAREKVFMYLHCGNTVTIGDKAYSYE